MPRDLPYDRHAYNGLSLHVMHQMLLQAPAHGAPAQAGTELPCASGQAPQHAKAFIIALCSGVFKSRSVSDACVAGHTCTACLCTWPVHVACAGTPGGAGAWATALYCSPAWGLAAWQVGQPLAGILGGWRSSCCCDCVLWLPAACNWLACRPARRASTAAAAVGPCSTACTVDQASLTGRCPWPVLTSSPPA